MLPSKSHPPPNYFSTILLSVNKAGVQFRSASWSAWGLRSIPLPRREGTAGGEWVFSTNNIACMRTSGIPLSTSLQPVQPQQLLQSSNWVSVSSPTSFQVPTQDIQWFFPNSCLYPLIFLSPSLKVSESSLFSLQSLGYCSPTSLTSFSSPQLPAKFPSTIQDLAIILNGILSLTWSYISHSLPPPKTSVPSFFTYSLLRS